MERLITRANEGTSPYCGPTAIGIIAGIDTDEATTLMRDFRISIKDRRVKSKGTNAWEMIQIIKRLGFYVVRGNALFEEYFVKSHYGGKVVQKGFRKFRKSINQFCKTEELENDVFYLVYTRNHVSIVRKGPNGNQIADSGMFCNNKGIWQNANTLKRGKKAIVVDIVEVRALVS